MDGKNVRDYVMELSFRDLCILKHSLLQYLNREGANEKDKKQENYLLVRLQELSHSKENFKGDKDSRNIRDYNISLSFKDLCILKHSLLKYLHRDGSNEKDKKQENYLLVRLQELSHSK